MSTDLPASDAPSATPLAPPRASLPWGGIAREGVVVVVAFVVAGVAGGWLWERLATPPSGVAYQGAWLEGVVVQDGGTYTTDYTALGRSFGVVGVYVVIGLVAGAALGILAAMRSRRSELATLLAVTVGSALAAYLAYRVGAWLGPSDPTPLAEVAEDGTPFRGALELPGKSPWVMWTLGALAGLTFTYVLTTGAPARTPRRKRHDPDPT